MRERGPQQRIQRLVSAGGVVYEIQDDSSIRVVLCGRHEPPRWSLPKGTPNQGEILEQTALREVREETGLDVVIEAPLGHIRYWFVSPDKQVRYHKTVHFYLMSPIGGCTDRHDPEFDEVRWFPGDQVLSSLTYASEAKMAERALVLVRQKVVDIQNGATTRFQGSPARETP